MVQEPSLNSTVLPRYSLKTRIKVVPFLLQKLGRIFCPTSITKIVNISGSTQSFFIKQRPLDSQLDNKSFHHTIEVFSSTFKNSPELLSKLDK